MDATNAATGPTIGDSVNGGERSFKVAASPACGVEVASFPAHRGISTTTTPTAAGGSGRVTVSATELRQDGSLPSKLSDCDAEHPNVTRDSADTPGAPPLYRGSLSVTVPFTACQGFSPEPLLGPGAR